MVAEKTTLKKVYAKLLYRKEDCPDRSHVYGLSDGTRVYIAQRDLESFGLAQILAAHGYELVDDSVPVYQFGKKIGRVPGDFHPARIKSKSGLYDPRPRDFVFKTDRWVACSTLCPGDFDAIPGFVWERE